VLNICAALQVLPNAVLVYDAELVDFVATKESYEMSDSEKVGTCWITACL